MRSCDADGANCIRGQHFSIKKSRPYSCELGFVFSLKHRLIIMGKKRVFFPCWIIVDCRMVWFSICALKKEYICFVYNEPLSVEQHHPLTWYHLNWAEDQSSLIVIPSKLKKKIIWAFLIENSFDWIMANRIPAFTLFRMRCQFSLAQYILKQRDISRVAGFCSLFDRQWNEEGNLYRRSSLL